MKKAEDNIFDVEYNTWIPKSLFENIESVWWKWKIRLKISVFFTQCRNNQNQNHLIKYFFRQQLYYLLSTDNNKLIEQKTAVEMEWNHFIYIQNTTSLEITKNTWMNFRVGSAYSKWFKCLISVSWWANFTK